MFAREAKKLRFSPLSPSCCIFDSDENQGRKVCAIDLAGTAEPGFDEPIATSRLPLNCQGFSIPGLVRREKASPSRITEKQVASRTARPIANANRIGFISPNTRSRRRNRFLGVARGWLLKRPSSELFLPVMELFLRVIMLPRLELSPCDRARNGRPGYGGAGQARHPPPAGESEDEDDRNNQGLAHDQGSRSAVQWSGLFMCARPRTALIHVNGRTPLR